MSRDPHPVTPTRTNTPGEPVLRSSGPSGEPIHGLGLYDPVQIGWLRADICDDIDPEVSDPFVAGNDALAARGLALRHWRKDDLRQYRGLLDDPGLWAHLPEPYPAPLGDEQASALIETSNMPAHHAVRAVVLSGRPIGQIRLHFTPGDTARHDGELSYWLGRAHWGKGLASALVSGAVRRIHANMPGLLRLVAKARPENTASIRVLEKAGFAPIAPPAGRGFADWRWFGLRRHRMAQLRDQDG